MLKNKCTILMIFSVLLVISACERDEDLFTIGNENGPSLPAIIQFQSIPDTTIADSITPANIKIKVNSEATSGSREVKLVTSLGSFSNNDTAIVLLANSAGELSVPLISNKTGLAFIRATAVNISIDTVFAFTTAFSEDIILESDKYVMDTTESAVITATLFRNTGKVSDPVKVFFTAKPDLPVIPLQIIPFMFSENKAAIVTVSNPFHSQGWFTITAATLKQNGDTLQRSIRLKVN